MSTMYDRADNHKRALYDRADAISKRIEQHLSACIARNGVCMCSRLIDGLYAELNAVNDEIVRYGRKQR